MGIFLLILRLFPLIAATIQEIEVTAPVPKAGPAKLELLNTTVSAAYQADPTGRNYLSEAKLLDIVETIASATVTFYNLTGVFKKS